MRARCRVAPVMKGQKRMRQLWSKLQRWLTDLWVRMRYRVGESGWARVPRLADLRERLSALPSPALPQLRRPSWAQARTLTERNILYLYVEIFWSGIFMAVVAFNATYALRLGATNTMIGWLSSIPSLFAMVVLLPAARFLEGKSNRAPWLYWSLFVGRAAFLGAALAPWLFPRHAAEAVIGVLIVRTVPMHFYSAGFSPMLADVIPPRDRALVIANRNIIMGATVAVCTFLFGRWMDAASGLQWASFPMNYQLVYIVGAVAGLLSTYFASRVQLPEVPVVRRERPARRALPRLAELRAAVAAQIRANRDFVRIVANTVVFDFGAWFVGPLYMIFFVKQLGASDGWVGMNTTVAQIGVIVGYSLWRRWMDRLGVSRTLLMAVPLVASYPFLVSFFPNLTLILVWGALINLISPGVSLSHVNALYSLCPAERRASYMAVYSTVANVGAFVAPMLGVALSNIIDIRWILLIGGGIRLAGAGMFHLFKIKLPEAATA